VRHLLDRYPDMAPDEVRWEEVARDLLALSGRGILSLSEEMLLLLLTLRNLEEIGRGLAPQVSLTGEMAEPFQAALAARRSWAARGERLLQAGRSWLEALADFPEEASRFLRVLGEGDWQVGVEMRNWQRPMRRLERMANRLVLSILMAGLTLALALLLTALLPAGSPWGWVVAGLALSGLLLLVALLLASFFRGMG
jgi:ubiquinone biosynthesis protein